MQYNFDQLVDRTNTNSLKYDFAEKRGKPKNILPFWVADMDFSTPDPIKKALKERVEHGIFGYTNIDTSYFNVVKDWYKRRFDWEPVEEWLVTTPGVVFAITTAIHAFTEVGDGILIQEPVYYPFRGSVELTDRKVILNTLVYDKNTHTYTIDFDDFEEKIKPDWVKLFIMSNPHNPVGRVWTEDELRKIGNLCLKHNVLVVSDEIHQDFIFKGHQHLVFTKVDPAFEAITIICTSPSKTFNLAALQISNIFIPNKRLRHDFVKAMYRSGYNEPNVMGLISCKAAYEHGDSWLEELKDYLEKNLVYIRTFIKEKMPKVKLVEPEGTYLAWFDFSGYGLNDKEINKLIVEKANLWLDDGQMFGETGTGFQRINYAVPRSLLVQAMNNLAQAFSTL